MLVSSLEQVSNSQFKVLNANHCLIGTWGILADLIGRRLSFNITLFIAGVFGIAAGGANTFTTLGALIACVGFGVGGK